MGFLPVSKKEMRALGWDAVDFCLVTGDAYVDHPTFANAVIGRVLEDAGFKVGIIAQPDWKDEAAYGVFGAPRLGFLVSAGNLDSMVSHYTVAKKPRREDSFSPGGKGGKRPDRATLVYCNGIRKAFGEVPIVIGGVEASLRRFAHYDYWDNRIRRSILVDSGADLLVYGMGEAQIVAIARALEAGRRAAEIRDVPGTCFMAREDELPEGVTIPSFEQVHQSREEFAKAFMAQYREQDPVRGKVLIQKQDARYLIQNPPAMPLSGKALDRVYELPYERRAHPSYEPMGGVPALEEVQFSLCSSRGCFGGCSFCALTFHQGRIVTARSHESLLREAQLLIRMPEFKGYIHDVGGPTANFRAPACRKQLDRGTCPNKQCLYPSPCKQLRADHKDYVALLRKLRELPGVKKVFIRSGLRFDYIMADRDGTFMKELVAHHVSGQLKVAPEHISPWVLERMGKPPREVYDRFVQRYQALNRQMGKKQYLVPYFMSSHPGSDLNAAIALAEYLRDSGQQPEQVQDFYPTPGTLSTCMYYTGLDPRDMQPVYVPKSASEKAMQRALLQYKSSHNYWLVRKALEQAERIDLIGNGKRCLIGERPPRTGEGTARRTTAQRPDSKQAPHKGAQAKGQHHGKRPEAARGKPHRDENSGRGGKARTGGPKKTAGAPRKPAAKGVKTLDRG